MKRYLLFFVFLFTLACISNIDDAYAKCDAKDIADYKQLASNINVSYSHKMVDGEPVFSITFTNIHPDIAIYDVNNEKRYDSSKWTADNELTLDKFKAGERLNFKINLDIYTCYDQTLLTRYVTLPNFNKYYSDVVCKDAQEFSLCQKWSDNKYDYDTFVAKVEKYKENRSTPRYADPGSKELSMKDKIFRFIAKYYIYLVSFVVLIVLLLAGLKSDSVRKNQFDFKV